MFHGWQLIAQQDYYSEFTQNYFGNHTEWKHETSYAITQPNGQVLALFNPQGKKVWAKEKGTLWGLLFPNDYRKTSPLDPQLLFSGQYYDDESGLAYNRFHYYDPQSGNYLSSDPIGLNGGETPYGYVHNPMGSIDPFGLTSYTPPGKKSSYFATSRKEALNKAKRDAGIPKTQHPYKVEKVNLKDGYGDFVRKNNGEKVTARQYYYKNSKGDDIVIQEHSLGHAKAAAGKGKEPHFNVRPIDNLDTGYYLGTYGHYNF